MKKISFVNFITKSQTMKNNHKVKHTPIIFLSSMTDEKSIIKGFENGAVDYITKPFRPVVLGAKVKALLRRTNNVSEDSSSVTRGIFRYDTSALRFYKNDREIELSSKENALMFLFMQNPNQIFTKEMIYEHVWGNTIIIDDNSIMVYISRLRNKIEDDPQNPVYIQTVRGLGYRFTSV